MMVVHDPKRLGRECLDPGTLQAGEGDAPERVLQIGEGRFLRGFADWVVQQLNQQAGFQGRVVVVAPRASGGANIRQLRQQDGLFTVALKGLQAGKMVDQHEIIRVVSRALEASEWESVLQVVGQAETRLIISNTTEAGLEYVPEPYQVGQSPTSFPAKVTALLYHRYQCLAASGQGAITILPTELVEKNGDQLRSMVLHHAHDWAFPHAFIDWLDRATGFCNTLVDRIVTGYPEGLDPHALAEDLGYTDSFYTVAEPFYLWVIEADDRLKSLWPPDKLPSGVQFVEDVTPFQRTKVRILNGAHTALYPVASLAKVATVAEVMNHAVLGGFVRALVTEEIIPALADQDSRDHQRPLALEVLSAYAQTTFERFCNPFLHHQVSALALNNPAKIRARLVPTLHDYAVRFRSAPVRLALAMAAHWIVSQQEMMAAAVGDSDRAGGQETVYGVGSSQLRPAIDAWLSPESAWGEDLTKIPDLGDRVERSVRIIWQDGIEEAVRRL